MAPEQCWGPPTGGPTLRAGPDVVGDDRRPRQPPVAGHERGSPAACGGHDYAVSCAVARGALSDRRPFLHALDAGEPAQPASGTTAPARRRTAVWIALAAVAIAAAGLAPALRYWRQAAPPPAPPLALAIVPFFNASGEASLDAAGPAIAELIRRSMADGSAIRVLSGARTTQLHGRSASDAGTLE